MAKICVIRGSHIEVETLSTALRKFVSNGEPNILVMTDDSRLFGVDIIDTDARLIYHIDKSGSRIETAAVTNG